ncbi:MAG: Rpn family recombination-promoting nuclease/putative transposase [Acetatifactor sp.]|nr:Rpn family recombination-promoting nuclease/putative transposase [Acetatifactor sp.]
MEIVSLKYDFSFKHLMLNEKVRKYFISDVLGIPVEEIRSARLSNPFLWKRYRKQKQGILDILVELNDDSKVNIELQIKMLAYWDRRSLFYLSKMYTENLLSGEKYQKLKRCICISIFDFRVDDSPEYHQVYRLRNEEGKEFSDRFEVHVIELGKELDGRSALDDWIRLFNVKQKEELNMLQTKNPGVLEAIEEVRRMSLGKGLWALYEAHLKEVRDRWAREDYVRMEGEEKGRAEGEALGNLKRSRQVIFELLEEHGNIPEDIRVHIEAEADMEKLREWHKAAARADTLEAFRKACGPYS